MFTRFTVISCALAVSFFVGFATYVPAQDAVEDPARRVNDGVPQGQIREGKFSDSEVYPGTTREYRVYVPQQYDEREPARLMVFMDGRNYARRNGDLRVPIVLDNLIHAGEIPVTVAVFVDPGMVLPTKEGAEPRKNRSFEYDSLGDRYTQFLVDEFLPVALEGLNVSADPGDRAVGGISSGGICAFTVAWERPDLFGKVLSHIGSYTNIRGGWAYPGLIRKTQGDPKPIKVYLQEGRDDLSNLHGNWPLGNRDMAAALQFAGYQYKFEMTEGGHNARAAGRTLPDALRWLWNDDAASTVIPESQTNPEWQPHPDALPRADVPKGVVHEMPVWESKIFPGTQRKWSVYVPAQYDPEQPAALMVFQDGERMRSERGKWRITQVFDNLIAGGDMPPTIGVFLDPGHHSDRPRRGGRFSNRGFEYDSLGPRYAQFLLEEILPVVEEQYSISKDPAMRAIGGSSSGAICAFTVAWERPDMFQKVYSNVGSFTNLRGGNVYPAWIRKTEQKPIRIYMADTSGDVDNAFGSWPIANERMASALKYMGYDARFDWAEGYGHNADFGSSKFPEAMRWLWRDAEFQPELDTSDDLGGDLTLLELLIPDQQWETVTEGLGFADAPCADAAGNFYYCDMRAPAVVRVSAETGEPTLLVKTAVSGLEFGPDGKLYGCQGSQRRVVAIDPDSGGVAVVAAGFQPNDLAVSSQGQIYVTETQSGRVLSIDSKTGTVSTAATGLAKPNGIVLTADEGVLSVSEYGGPNAWTFRVNADGSLDAKMPSMTLRRPIDVDGEFRFNEPPPYVASAFGDGMCTDKRGRYYVTSALGIQVFDPTCRPCGVLHRPDPEQPLTSCIMAGANHEYLYVTNGTKILRRKLAVGD